MSAPGSVLVGSLAAGETTEISVQMTAPDSDGKFVGVWRMVDGQGDYFGTTLTVVIQVGEPAADEAPPPPVASGQIGGGFELGGQTHTLAHPNEMHYAGMT